MNLSKSFDIVASAVACFTYLHLHQNSKQPLCWTWLPLEINVQVVHWRANQKQEQNGNTENIVNIENIENYNNKTNFRLNLVRAASLNSLARELQVVFGFFATHSVSIKILSTLEIIIRASEKKQKILYFWNAITNHIFQLPPKMHFLQASPNPISVFILSNCRKLP